MSKFHSLYMADEVAKHPLIKDESQFFGLWQKTIYIPTGSQVESFSNFYNENDAKRFKELIECPEKELAQYTKDLTEIECTPGANFRLDLCISQDCQFVAMQLNHVGKETMTHITPIRYFEGDIAKEVERCFK